MNPWCPYATRVAGRFADYGAGRIANLTTGLAHYTVGKNSIGTCGEYFQILAARDGTLFQGAPVDAVNWGSGDPWNGCSVHCEVEYLPGVDDTVFTDVQRDAVQAFAHWLHDEWGVPLDYYDGPRIPAHTGWISHRSLIQTGDYHNDFWPADDAAIIFGDTMTEADFDRIKLIVIGVVNDLAGGTNLDGSWVTTRLLEQKIDALPAGSGGLTRDEVAQIVRDELDRTRLAH